MEVVVDRVSAQAGILKLVESWVKAARKGDVAAVASHYASDVIAYDAVDRLQFDGIDSYREHWAARLRERPRPIVFDLHDLKVAATGDVGFAHGLVRSGGVNEMGEPSASWQRLTVAYRRNNGKWNIVHEHFSIPFDERSGTALVDLAP